MLLQAVDPGAIATTYGPWVALISAVTTIVMLVVRSLISGALIPRDTHLEALRTRDELIQTVSTERDFYRDLSFQLLGVAKTADATTRIILEKGLHEQPTEQRSPSP